MKALSSIWRAMTGAERLVVGAVTLALLVTVVGAAYGLLQRPGDVFNPNAKFNANKVSGKAKRPKSKGDRTIEWPRFGYDTRRTKFLDEPSIRPPFRKLWRYKGDELIEFPPIVVDGRAYFIDNAGLYVALDTVTGKVVWKKRLAKLNASSPAEADGVLYSVSLNPGQAIAVRARDGKVLWRKPLDNRAESSPLVVRGRMYFGDEDGQLYALRTRDGSTIWQTKLGGAVKAAPALDGGVLFVGDYGGIMNAVRATDGKIQWRTQDLGVGLGQSGRIYSTAAVAFGRVYAGDVDGRVYSYDERTGEIAWTFSAGDFVYSGIAAGTTKGTRPTVYFGSHDRNAYAVDAKSGKQIWKEKAGGQVSGPATVVGDVVYLSTFSGDATLGFDLKTGRRVFSFDDGQYGPVVSDGRNLYLTGGSTVTAFAPVDLGGYKYKTKPGQKGIVPPAERRKAEAAMRKGAGGGRKLADRKPPVKQGGEKMQAGQKPSAKKGGGKQASQKPRAKQGERRRANQKPRAKSGAGKRPRSRSRRGSEKPRTGNRGNRGQPTGGSGQGGKRDGSRARPKRKRG